MNYSDMKEMTFFYYFYSFKILMLDFFYKVTFCVPLLIAEFKVQFEKQAKVTILFVLCQHLLYIDLYSSALLCDFSGVSLLLT